MRVNKLAGIFLILVEISLFSACTTPAQETVKVALIAPFSGRYREIGYDVITATRLALQDFAQSNPGSLKSIELVAYDDQGSPEIAIQQATRITFDPAIKVVIGHWRDKTTLAAAKVYEQAHLRLITFVMDDTTTPVTATYNLSPTKEHVLNRLSDWLSEHNKPATITLDGLSESDYVADSFLSDNTLVIGSVEWGLLQSVNIRNPQLEFVSAAALPRDSQNIFWQSDRASHFANSYQARSLGLTPGLYATTAYEAAWLAFYMVDQNLPVSQLPLSPEFFDSKGRLFNPKMYLYQLIGGNIQLIDVMQ
jgi:hypothetical protein